MLSQVALDTNWQVKERQRKKKHLCKVEKKKSIPSSFFSWGVLGSSQSPDTNQPTVGKGVWVKCCRELNPQWGIKICKTHTAIKDVVKCAHLKESQLQNWYTCLDTCVQQRLLCFSKRKLFRKIAFKNLTHLPLFLNEIMAGVYVSTCLSFQWQERKRRCSIVL